MVEALHEADRATIVVAEDSAAGLTVQADAKGPLQGISLADPKIGLTVKSTRGKMVQVMGAEEIRPLYSCLCLEDPLVGSPTVQPVRGLSDNQEVRLRRPGIAELVNS